MPTRRPSRQRGAALRKPAHHCCRVRCVTRRLRSCGGPSPLPTGRRHWCRVSSLCPPSPPSVRAAPCPFPPSSSGTFLPSHAVMQLPRASLMGIRLRQLGRGMGGTSSLRAVSPSSPPPLLLVPDVRRGGLGRGTLEPPSCRQPPQATSADGRPRRRAKSPSDYRASSAQDILLVRGMCS